MNKLEPVCIYCGEQLSKWERTRSYCWNCNELTTAEAYLDHEELENHKEYEEYPEDENNWIDLIFP